MFPALAGGFFTAEPPGKPGRAGSGGASLGAGTGRGTVQGERALGVH